MSNVFYKCDVCFYKEDKDVCRACESFSNFRHVSLIGHPDPVGAPGEPGVIEETAIREELKGVMEGTQCVPQPDYEAMYNKLYVEHCDLKDQVKWLERISNRLTQENDQLRAMLRVVEAMTGHDIVGNRE